MLDVPDVALNAALHLPEFFGLAAVAGDLRPTGDAGFGKMAHHVFVDEAGVFLGVLEHVGTGADHAHFAAEDVDELGQLVDVRAAHDFAYAGLAGVVFGGLQAVALGVDAHGAEFVAPELAAVAAAAFLLEEDGAGRTEFDGRAEDE